MHEHLHSDMHCWEAAEFVTKEARATIEHRAYLLRVAVPIYSDAAPLAATRKWK